MFDSLSGGYAPVLVLTAIVAWLLALLRIVWLRWVLAVIAPILISFSWFFVPRFPALFKPLPWGQDPWVGWGIIAAMVWATYAIPLCLVATLVFTVLRKRRKKLHVS
ncbi:MAG TPA: hypothetical protein VN725_01315 [Rhodanobacteraceae bacterium]|nr:hypothetical protein [Rhodanobacteraceae bacterium]